MTMFQYLYECNLWQWCGNVACVALVAWGMRNWSFLNINSGMNSGCTTYECADKWPKGGR